MTDKDLNPDATVSYSGQFGRPELLPVEGTTIAEILTAIITPALKSRKDAWMLEIDKRLKELEQANKVAFQNLANNQSFIDTVLQATSHAIKTSDQEKIKIFRNVIVNSALGHGPEQIIGQIFLNLVDAFTIWHIKILKLFNNPKEWFKQHNKELPNYAFASLSRVIVTAFPELHGQGELINLIWSDLGRAGLHNSGDLGTHMGSDGLLAERTTSLGKQFLSYITENAQ